MGENSGAHVSLTNAIAPGSTVQIRFRFASDNIVGAAGWQIDNIAFTGVIEKHFTVLSGEADACNVTTPTPGGIQLSPATLPVATVGTPYTTMLTPSGGTGTYTYTVTPVVIPAGLSTNVVGGHLQISGTPTQAGTFLITVEATDSASNQGSANYIISVGKGTPTVTWNDPSDITYGTALSATQLNASASVPGTLTYTTPSGTVLGAGATQPLTVNFTPTDTANYNSTSKTVQLNVLKAGQTITFGALSNKTFGDTEFTISATASSGLAVTFAVTGQCSLT